MDSDWGWICVSLSLVFLGLGLGESASALRSSGLFSSTARERSELARVVAALLELEETLEAGLVPGAAAWDRVRTLAPPWGPLAWESLSELRSGGGAILPTLRRIRALAQEQAAALAEARAKSSQALAQALVCLLLTPAFGATLYTLLPGVEAHPWIWMLCCAGALGLGAIGAAWVLSLARAARWAGIEASRREWILAAHCAGERFLSLIRCGNPPDLAWSRMTEVLGREAPGLAARWGYAVFSAIPESGREDAFSAEHALAQAGQSIRSAIQASLMEGRPCSERVETVLHSLRQELRALVERELQLLGTRALKPLFLCVAPALFGLLAAGIALSWTELLGELA